MEEKKDPQGHFYIHSNLNANVSITLKGLSDANSVLGISMHQIMPEHHESIVKLCEKYSKLKAPTKYENVLKLPPSAFKLQQLKHPDPNEPREHLVDHVGINTFKKDFISECSIFIIVQLCNNGLLLDPAISTPRLRSLTFFEHIIFPISYSNLGPDAAIAISIYDMNKSPENGLIGGTCINLFNSQLCLRQGNFELAVHNDMVGDPTLHTTTPGLLNDSLVSELNKLHTYIDKHTRKEIKAIPWLDGLAHQTIFQKLEKLHHEVDYGMLEICLPLFEFPVLWKEQKYMKKDNFMSFSKFEKKLTEAFNAKNLGTQSDIREKYPKITLVCDPMIMSKKKEELLCRTNPIADKFYKLSSCVDEALAKDLRPTQEEMQMIEEILAKPDFHMMFQPELSLIWRYRYYLHERRDALIKVMLAVKWEIDSNAKEGLSLLHNWAPIELEQALMMLSFLFTMNTFYSEKSLRTLKYIKAIRSKGIAYLSLMNDEDLDVILMQLVQAYRYENHEDSELKKFLINRASKSLLIASHLMWYIKVETENPANGSMKYIYENFYNDFFKRMPSDSRIKAKLEAQIDLRKKLLRVGVIIKESKVPSEEKTKKLIKTISVGGDIEMCLFNPVPIPVNPRIEANGIVSEKCSVFKSSRYPAKLVFNIDPKCAQFTKDNSMQFQVIFKEGDDLRQDQLILQTIALMDELLKKVSVDLKFSIYKVIATGLEDGFVEFVTESTTISAINKKYPDAIVGFLNKMEIEKKLSKEAILDTYVKSCAGYSAVTYLLGIGDRHLENLMIRNSGALFHIDYGFILGKDPKPFPPPIRICKEMVLAMGGNDSPTYDEFCRKCVDAFMYLRKHCKLIVNLFYLMLHSGIKDLEDKGDGTSKIMKLYERFMPDKDEQDAERGFLQLIHGSVNAYFPNMMELLHDWALYFK